jgi:hypothetical protein
MRTPFFVLAVALAAVVVPAVGPSYAESREPARHAARGVRHVHVPAAGRAVGTRHPDHVVGDGTPASCTSSAVVRAVAQGGVITFDCGPAHLTIPMTHTAKVRTGHLRADGSIRPTRRVVIDGGGRVTLSGMGKRRILYQDTCDPHQLFTTDHCQAQPLPKLVVQHLTFADGDSTGNLAEGGGGGAILARGGQLKVVDTHFVDNRCDRTGPDLGGAAVRALSQVRPVYVVHSSFRGGRCSNGSGLSSIGVSWTVLNSVFVGNKALGHGANPPHRPGQPGGGSGGAIYTDGDRYTVRVGGTLMRHDHANEGGGAIFYVSNDSSGTLHLRWSTLEHDVSAGFETLPGIFYKGHGPVHLHHTVLR